MDILLTVIVTFFAGMGAGLGTGFAGMSAAAVISPMLITFLHMDPYMAVGIALSSDVLASAISAYTYHKNKNLDIKNGLIMMASVLVFTVVGSYVAKLVPSTTMGGFSVCMTFLLGIKFIVRPVMTTKEAMAGVSAGKRAAQSVVCGVVIGFICGFIGAGGGMMMLLILTSVMGYDLYGLDRCGITLCHRRSAGYSGVGAVRDLYAGLGADRRRVCQQGGAQDPEPGHRCGAGGAGRGDHGVQAAAVIGPGGRQQNRGLREWFRAALCGVIGRNRFQQSATARPTMSGMVRALSRVSPATRPEARAVSRP